jgi:hypothetical protein
MENYYYILIIFSLLIYIYYISSKKSIEMHSQTSENIINYNIQDKMDIINNFCTNYTYLLDNKELMNVYIVNILTKNECKWIIDESEKYADIHGWRQERSDGYKIEDNLVIKISNIFYFIHNIIFTRIVKHYEKYFNVPADFIGIYDCSIIKYKEDGVRSLESHVDIGDFSFILSLNDEFEGGYTYFDFIEKKFISPVGSALLFCGQNRHRGLEITKGTRYILVGFLNINKQHYCKKMMNLNK